MCAISIAGETRSETSCQTNPNWTKLRTVAESLRARALPRAAVNQERALRVDLAAWPEGL